MRMRIGLAVFCGAIILAVALVPVAGVSSKIDRLKRRAHAHANAARAGATASTTSTSTLPCTEKKWTDRINKCKTYYHTGTSVPMAFGNALDRLQRHVAGDDTAFDGLKKGGDVVVKAAATASAKDGNGKTRRTRRRAKEYAVHVNAETGEAAIVSAGQASAPTAHLVDTPVITAAHTHPWPHPDGPWPLAASDAPVKWDDLLTCTWVHPKQMELRNRVLPSAADIAVITKNGKLDAHKLQGVTHEHWLLTPYLVDPTTRVLYDPAATNIPTTALMLSFTFSACEATGQKVNAQMKWDDVTGALTVGAVDYYECTLTVYGVAVDVAAHTTGARRVLGTVTKVGGNTAKWARTCGVNHKPTIVIK